MSRRIAVLTLVALASCSSPKRAERAPAPVQGPLSYVAADTPYVFASFEPYPDNYLRRSMTVLRGAFKAFETVIAGAGAGDDPGERAVILAFAGLRDKLSPEGLASIGIDLRGQWAVWGAGVLPVMRFQLADAAAFRAFVEGILTESGMELGPEQTIHGRAVWVFGDDLQFAIAIDGDTLVGAMAPAAAMEGTLAVAFGVDRPPKSLADADGLVNLAAARGLRGYQVGVIEIVRLAAIARGKGDALAVAQLAAFDANPADMPSACRDEIGMVAAALPRIVGGSIDASASGLKSGGRIETSAAVAAHLEPLAVPMHGMTRFGEMRPLLAFGLALDVNAVVEHVVEPLSAVPFQCPWFQIVADNAAEVSQLADSPVGALVRGVRGVQLAWLDLVPGPLGRPVARGYAILAHGDLDAVLPLLGAQLGLPAIEDGGAPVSLELPPPLGDYVESAVLVRRGGYLGIAVGKGALAQLEAALAATPSADPPAIAFAYDERSLYERAAMFPALYPMLLDDDDPVPGTAEEKDFATATADGFAHGAVWFRKAGMVFEGHEELPASTTRAGTR